MAIARTPSKEILASPMMARPAQIASLAGIRTDAECSHFNSRNSTAEEAQRNGTRSHPVNGKQLTLFISSACVWPQKCRITAESSWETVEWCWVAWLPPVEVDFRKFVAPKILFVGSPQVHVTRKPRLKSVGGALYQQHRTTLSSGRALNQSFVVVQMCVPNYGSIVPSKCAL